MVDGGSDHADCSEIRAIRGARPYRARWFHGAG
jgi:hypothetical protein